MPSACNEPKPPKYWSQKLEQLSDTHCERVFSELHGHFAPMIRGFLQSQTGNMPIDTIEELVQEVMIKVWKKASSYDSSKAAASTWIFTLTRNTRIDHIRKHARHNELTEPLTTDDIWEEDETNQPFVYLHQARAERDVKAMMANLPIEQSLCLQKMYMEGKSHSEISEDLNLPLGTVKSRVRLALKRLQSHLGVQR